MLYIMNEETLIWIIIFAIFAGIFFGVAFVVSFKGITEIKELMRDPELQDNS